MLCLEEFFVFLYELLMLGRNSLLVLLDPRTLGFQLLIVLGCLDSLLSDLSQLPLEVADLGPDRSIVDGDEVLFLFKIGHHLFEILE